LVLRANGARRSRDLDVCVQAIKLLLTYSILAHATLRFTRAAQLGILGSGDDRNDRHQPEREHSGARLINRHVALGAEYWMKPDNLGFACEQDWFAVFFAFFSSKNISLTASWLEAGSIATRPRQHGPFLGPPSDSQSKSMRLIAALALILFCSALCRRTPPSCSIGWADSSASSGSSIARSSSALPIHTSQGPSTTPMSIS
jgi:hypothetical protein